MMRNQLADSAARLARSEPDPPTGLILRLHSPKRRPKRRSVSIAILVVVLLTVVTYKACKGGV